MGRQGKANKLLGHNGISKCANHKGNRIGNNDTNERYDNFMVIRHRLNVLSKKIFQKRVEICVSYCFK